MLIQLLMRVGILRHEIAGFNFMGGPVERSGPALKLPLNKIGGTFRYGLLLLPRIYYSS